MDGLTLSIPQVLLNEPLSKPSTDLILPGDSLTYRVILPNVVTLLEYMSLLSPVTPIRKLNNRSCRLQGRPVVTRVLYLRTAPPNVTGPRCLTRPCRLKRPSKTRLFRTIVLLLKPTSKNRCIHLTLSRTTCLLVWTTQDVTINTENKKSPCRFLLQPLVLVRFPLHAPLKSLPPLLSNEFKVNLVKVFSGFTATNFRTLLTYPFVFTTSPTPLPRT